METNETYQCERCGAETDLPADVARKHCAICGTDAAELEGVRCPQSTRTLRAVAANGEVRLPLA